MARELNDQLYVAGQPSRRFIREIQEVKRIEEKHRRKKFDAVTVTDSGELVFKDLHAELDQCLELEQRQNAQRALLTMAVAGIGILYCLNTAYELNVTHAVAARGEDVRCV